MKLTADKEHYYQQPVSHQLLRSLLSGYKRPNDKVRAMLEKGELIALKKGLYVWNVEGRNFPEPFVLANAIYGPSYISAESALAHHGLIPEQVFSVVSMTLKRSNDFDNHFGNFVYKKLPTPYYAFGIEYVKLQENQFAQIACPEKAIADKIITTPGILLRSIKTSTEFLIENLRIDSEDLKKMDVEKIKSWLPDAPKKEALKFVVKTLEAL